jgi:nucleoside-diphosphate-sugar epimerase
MTTAERTASIVDFDDRILVTGAAGFIGRRVVDALTRRGYRNVRCLVRRASGTSGLARDRAGLDVVEGNLLSREDCRRIAKDVAVVIHLAAGTGETSFPDAFLNSVVTTRNLLDACVENGGLRRFVNVSTFAVYTNTALPRRRVLDESAPIETRPQRRADAYCYAKVKQEQIVREYGEKFGIPHVTVRPGSVYGPGRGGVPARVGLGTFGVFLHLGGSNSIPLTYVDNCADAIALAALRAGIDGEAFNVVDDDLPSSRQFLRLYKKHVQRFGSIYVPHAVSYGSCWLWQKYSAWSKGQLPPVFNLARWHTQWKRTRYTNDKLKTRVGWTPRVSMEEGLKRYFESCAEVARDA